LGEPGVDYSDLQFIASFKPGFLTIPDGKSEEYLKNCQVEADLFSLLEQNEVYYVKQAFKSYQPGDTIRIIGSDTCFVPDLSQVYLFLQNEGVSVADAVDSMYSHEATLYAEPNFIRTTTRTPYDPQWYYQWNLQTPDNTSSFGIGCTTAWDGTVGDRTVKLAIIDTGINHLNEDLGSFFGPGRKVAGGYDYADNDNNPLDYHGHGTKCAGVAGALTNNDIHVSGIAGGWDRNGDDIGASLYAIKIFDNAGYYGGDAAAANAIWEAADPEHFGCSILSNSWGGYGYSETLRMGIHWAYRVGVSFVASKGNDGSGNPHYPSDFDYSWVTAVGSYGQNGIYCQASNCGYTSNYGRGIDISAPGTLIPTTTADGDYTLGFAGTSAACPHASGSIALLRTLEEGLRNEDTDWILKFSAWDPPPDESDGNEWTWHERYGHGELRVSTAISRIYNPYYVSQYEFFSHTATGGYDVGHSDYQGYTFLGSPLQGNYYVKRYDVRVNVTYPEKFMGIPYVWGIGHNTTSWSAANPNYQVGYCRLVPGSQTLAGCQLQTYVYEVWNSLGQYMGWYPCTPGNVSLQYKLWGKRGSSTPDSPGGLKISSDEIPNDFYLYATYPNPFNSSTTMFFSNPLHCRVSLSIYDLLGRKVTILLDKDLPAGYHHVAWDGKNSAGNDSPSGVYFYRLEANGQAFTKKMSLLR